MARTLPGSFSTAIANDEINVLFAIDIDFKSAPLYVWSGYDSLLYNSKTYLGAGQVMSISALEESSEIEAKGASVTLTGVPSSMLSLALTEEYQGVECRIYIGTYNSGTYSFLEAFTGELDQMNIQEEAESATITVTVENILIKLERPVIRRLTSEDQKSRYSDDKGLEYVAYIQDKNITWGKQ